MYAKDTFCAGKYSGQGTIRTRIGRLTYANLNAILKLSKEIDLPNSTAPVIPDVTWKFTLLQYQPYEK
jgi:hypothetical protein